jgi:hypothetical protein
MKFWICFADGEYFGKKSRENYLTGEIYCEGR